jgi:hypothetical protein
MIPPLALPRREQDLYDLLAHKGDVSIDILYQGMKGPPCDDMRRRQQWLGPYTTGLNRRLKNHKLRVKPGRLKNTYALVAL